MQVTHVGGRGEEGVVRWPSRDRHVTVRAGGDL